VTSQPNAVVDAAFTGADGAVQEGLPRFKTIAAALRAAPSDGAKPYALAIKNGRYHEKLTVNKPAIVLRGESRDGTVITYDDSADSKPGGGALGTAGSATLTVSARDVRAENLTVENAFDYLANRAKPADDPTKVANAQAVALRTDRASDRLWFRNVAITGYQDTLLADSGRHYFQKCLIAGCVDFIFGAGTAVFDDCDIISRDLGSATNNGYVTAASTPLSSPYGFVFLGCRLKKERPTMADNSVALGRPWHPTTTLPGGARGADPNAVASVLFKNCTMEGHIASRGWDSMSGRDASGETVVFQPQDARFAEFGSTGPGARSSPSRPQFPADRAAQLTAAKILSGWDPTT
jgi:pectinesterase